MWSPGLFLFLLSVAALGNSTFICPEENGYFRNRDDKKCMSFWVCKDGAAELSKCPEKRMFHAVANKCVEDEFLVCMAIPVMPRKLSRVARDKGSSKGSEHDHHEEHKSSSSSDSSKKDIHKSSHSSSSEHKSHKKDKDHKDISNTSDHKKETKDSHIEYEKHYYHKEYFPVPIQVAAAAAPVVPGVLGGGFPFAANQVQYPRQFPAYGANLRRYTPQYPTNNQGFQRYQSQRYQQQMPYPQNSLYPKPQPSYYDYYMPPSFDQYDDTSYNQPSNPPSQRRQSQTYTPDNYGPQQEPRERNDQRFQQPSYDNRDFRSNSREETMPRPPVIDPVMPQSPRTPESPGFQSDPQPTLYPARINDPPSSQPTNNERPLFQSLPVNNERQPTPERNSGEPSQRERTNPPPGMTYPFGLSSSHDPVDPLFGRRM